LFMEFELEKKFLLEKLPEGLGDPVLVQQGYLYTEPFEFRVRRKGAQCFMTYKSAGDEERVEWEKEIPEMIFDELLTKKVGRTIKKNRYQHDRDGHRYEFDEYLDEFEGLLIVEIEFQGREAFESFQPPAWLGNVIDVTKDSQYKNKNLATMDKGVIKSVC
jgi:adenylate cyclase